MLQQLKFTVFFLALFIAAIVSYYVVAIVLLVGCAYLLGKGVVVTKKVFNGKTT